MNDITEILVRHIVNTKYEDIPYSEIASTKKNILDTAGAIIAGSSEIGIKEVVDLIRQWGGRKEATILIYGGKVPAHHAAIAIGAMARARELGSVHLKPTIHASETVLPAALAMAEYAGPVSGKDLITAVILGEDIICRLGMATNQSIMITGRGRLIRSLGPAAACAKILGLDEEKTHNTLGIAYGSGFSSLDLQQNIDGAMTTFLHYGFCAEGAIKAALLANNGITGTKNILQGKWGYFNVVEPDSNLEPVTLDLGKRFEGAYASTKPYPSCKCTHMSINATLDLLSEKNIVPENVAEVEVSLGDQDFQMTFLPHEERYNPPNIVSARFSLPFCLAIAVDRRSVALDDFKDETLKSPEIQRLMAKVKGRPDARFSVPGVQSSASIKIITKEGKAYCKQKDMLKGDADNPFTMEEIADMKFRRNLPFSAKKIPEKNTEAIIEMISHLEEVSDVTQIIKLMTP